LLPTMAFSSPRIDWFPMIRWVINNYNYHFGSAVFCKCRWSVLIVLLNYFVVVCPVVAYIYSKIPMARKHYFFLRTFSPVVSLWKTSPFGIRYVGSYLIHFMGFTFKFFETLQEKVICMWCEAILLIWIIHDIIRLYQQVHKLINI